MFIKIEWIRIRDIQSRIQNTLICIHEFSLFFHKTYTWKVHRNASLKSAYLFFLSRFIFFFPENYLKRTLLILSSNSQHFIATCNTLSRLATLCRDLQHFVATWSQMKHMVFDVVVRKWYEKECNVKIVLHHSCMYIFLFCICLKKCKLSFHVSVSI